MDLEQLLFFANGPARFAKEVQSGQPGNSLRVLTSHLHANGWANPDALVIVIFFPLNMHGCRLLHVVFLRSAPRFARESAVSCMHGHLLRATPSSDTTAYG